MEIKRIVRPLEIKSIDEKGVFTGYGSVFGNTDSYQDVVVKGAFTKSLDETPAGKVKMLWQHDTSQPIGVYEVIKEKEHGLFVTGRLLIDDVQQAKEAYALLKAGAVDGLSIGYTTKESEIGKDGKRYLNELKLWEISIVTFPANELSIVNGVKSADQIITIRDFEKFLREAGFSKQKAKAISANGFKSVESQRDADEKAHTDDLLESLKRLNQSIKLEVKYDHRN